MKNAWNVVTKSWFAIFISDTLCILYSVNGYVCIFICVFLFSSFVFCVFGEMCSLCPVNSTSLPLTRPFQIHIVYLVFCFMCICIVVFLYFHLSIFFFIFLYLCIWRGVQLLSSKQHLSALDKATSSNKGQLEPELGRKYHKSGKSFSQRSNHTYQTWNNIYLIFPGWIQG